LRIPIVPPFKAGGWYNKLKRVLTLKFGLKPFFT